MIADGGLVTSSPVQGVPEASQKCEAWLQGRTHHMDRAAAIHLAWHSDGDALRATRYALLVGDARGFGRFGCFGCSHRSNR